MPSLNLALLLILCLIIILIAYRSQSNFTSLEKPPIWFCWPGNDPMPVYLQLCIDTFRKHNSKDFNIIVIRPDDIPKLLDYIHPAYDYLRYAHRADYIRVNILNKYGGIYVDCDTICLRNLKDLYKKAQSYDIVGYVDVKAPDDYISASMLGPMKAHNPVISYIQKQQNAILDKKYQHIKKISKDTNPEKNDNVLGSKDDGLVWGEILVALFKKQNLKIPAKQSKRGILLKTINPSEKQLFSKHTRWVSKIPKGTHCVILNNAYYGKKLKAMSIDQLRAMNNGLSRLLFNNL